MGREIQRWQPGEYVAAEFRLWMRGLPLRHPFLVYAMLLYEAWPRVAALFKSEARP